MMLDDFKGNAIIKERIGVWLETERINHAYIFAGQKGLGKKTMSRIFIKAAMCENREGSVPCGVCLNCKKIDSSSHPDVKWIEIEEKKTGISIEQVRQLINDMPFLPNEASRKFYVVDDAHTMSVQAQNALLKSFEEPASFVTIILLTQNERALVPTIRSRAHCLAFEKVKENEVMKYLLDNAYSGQKAKEAAKLSGGVIGRAIELANDPQGHVSLAEQFCGHLFSGDFSDFIKWGKKEFRTSGDMEGFFFELAKIMRDALIHRENVEFLEPISSQTPEYIREKFKKTNGKNILNIIDITQNTVDNLRKNANFNAATTDFMCRVWEEING